MLTRSRSRSPSLPAMLRAGFGHLFIHSQRMSQLHRFEITTLRLYLLRAMYLFIAVGLVLTVWPAIIAPPNTTANASTVVRSLLGALAVLCLLGLRYPLQMLPLLLFELLWKVIWVRSFRRCACGCTKGSTSMRPRHCSPASWVSSLFPSPFLGVGRSGQPFRRMPKENPGIDLIHPAGSLRDIRFEVQLPVAKAESQKSGWVR